MLNIIRMSFAKLSAISSCFRIKQGNLHPLIILSSSTLHTSKHPPLPPLRLPDLKYAFHCINNIDEAVALFHYMLQMNPTPSSYHYNELFRTLLKMEHYSYVILMFKKLSLQGCVEVNEYILNTVIDCYSHLELVELGFAVIGDFLKRGCAPDIVIFNCLIKGFFIKGKVVEGVELFKNLVKGKVYEVTEYTIGTVLNGLTKSGYIVDAVELLRLSEKKDWKVDVAGYNTVIDGLCKGRMLKDGMDLLVRMVDKDVLPDVVSYTCLLYGLCSSGNLDFACSIFNDLPSKGIVPDVFAYTVIIQGLCREGLFRDAKELLEKMERVGCFPNGVTYNVIIQGCLHHRDSFGSVDLIKQIVGRDFQLDAPSFFLLLRQIRVLRQMKGVYDDDAINQLIQKLISSGAVHQMRDDNDEFMINSLIRKLNSSNYRCSL